MVRANMGEGVEGLRGGFVRGGIGKEELISLLSAACFNDR
jgi:hypothetical protein